MAKATYVKTQAVWRSQLPILKYCADATSGAGNTRFILRACIREWRSRGMSRHIQQQGLTAFFKHSCLNRPTDNGV